MATDAFAQDWSGENNYCFPPVQLAAQLAQFLEETGAAASVVVPEWPLRPWYHLLLRRAVDVFYIDARPRLLIAGPNPGASRPLFRRLAVMRFGDN